MRYFLFRLLPAVFLIFTLNSCYNGPSSDEIYNESDVILTQYNKSYDFSSQKYFAVYDKIYTTQLDAKGKISKDSLSDSDAKTLTDQIVKDMVSKGYKQVVKDVNGNFGYQDGSTFVLQEPDLGINALLLSNVTQVNTVVWGWWYDWGYWGWWDYPYYPYYPYYPGYVSSFSYTVGALVVEMFEYTPNATSDTKIAVSWTGVIRGIDTGAKSTNLAKGVNGISQMFTQSPYIQSM